MKIILIAVLTAALALCQSVKPRIDNSLDQVGSGFSVASQAEAEAGTDNTKGMTPLRVANAIKANIEGGDGLAAPTATTAGIELNVDGTVMRIATGTGTAGACTDRKQWYWETDAQILSACDGTNYQQVYPAAASTAITAASAAAAANRPVFSAGADRTAQYGTRSGNTTEVATVTGTKTTGVPTQFDADGNITAASGLTPRRVCTFTPVTGVTSATSTNTVSDTCTITAGTIAANAQVSCEAMVARATVSSTDANTINSGFEVNGTFIAGGHTSSASAGYQRPGMVVYNQTTASQVLTTTTMSHSGTALGGNSTAGLSSTIDTATTDLVIKVRLYWSAFTDDTLTLATGACYIR